MRFCQHSQNGESIAEVVERQRNVRHVFADQGHGGLQVVALGPGHTHLVLLNGALNFEFALFEQFLNLFGQFALDAVAHLDDLLDLVATHLLDVALVKEAHVHVALGEFVAQHVFNLCELELGITDQGDFLVLDLNAGSGAFEVKACGDFLDGVFHGVFYFYEVGFTNGVKGWHNGLSRAKQYGKIARAGPNATIVAMVVEKNVPLQPWNTFGIAARALNLVRIREVADLLQARSDPALSQAPFFVLGGGSNIVLTGDVKPTVLKMEIKGFRLVEETAKAWIVEAGAGEAWHDCVAWTLRQGYPGLENMALIPGTVGASPVQNIGAYGVELQDRFESLDAVDMATGQVFTLTAEQCAFGYRDSVFKHGAPVTPIEREGVQPLGLAGRAVITHVRFRLPRPWKPELGYLDLERRRAEAGIESPTAQEIFDWVCEIRRAKLPDPAVLGNAGSFFKNPTVTPEQCSDIIAREPRIVHYPMPDGSVKLAAGWLIDACGWRGKTIGKAGVYEKQALVLVNRGTAQDSVTGGEVMTLAKAIQTSVYERFGIRLEPEPVVV